MLGLHRNSRNTCLDWQIVVLQYQQRCAQRWLWTFRMECRKDFGSASYFRTIRPKSIFNVQLSLTGSRPSSSRLLYRSPPPPYPSLPLVTSRPLPPALPTCRPPLETAPPTIHPACPSRLPDPPSFFVFATRVLRGLAGPAPSEACAMHRTLLDPGNRRRIRHSGMSIRRDMPLLARGTRIATHTRKCAR